MPDRAVGSQWSGPTDSPFRLDLTLRPDEAELKDFWTVLRRAKRSVPGCVRVVVLQGLSGLPDSDDGAVLDWRSQPSFVSVAVLDRLAEGSALDLALGCDLRVVTPEAVLSRPGLLSADALASAVGYPRALDLAVTGRSVTGTEAYALGLAQRLVPAEVLDAEVEALVSDLLTPDRDLVRELKALLLGASERGARAQREAQAEAVQRLKSLRPHGAARA